MSDAATLQQPMSREEYRRWALGRRGRYERIGGMVVALPAERLSHVRAKQAVWQALANAIKQAGLVDCEAFMDGATVEVDENTDYEPDAVVNYGPKPPGDAIATPNPIIIVEVLSPSTSSADTGFKLADYFLVPSIQHYLIVDPMRPRVIHHRRNGDAIATIVLTSGRLQLDPPGLSLRIDDLYPEPAPSSD